MHMQRNLTLKVIEELVKKEKSTELTSLNSLNTNWATHLRMELKISHRIEKFRMDRSGFEPEPSCLRSKRSTADLPALIDFTADVGEPCKKCIHLYAVRATFYYSEFCLGKCHNNGKFLLRCYMLCPYG